LWFYRKNAEDTNAYVYLDIIAKENFKILSILEFPLIYILPIVLVYEHSD